MKRSIALILKGSTTSFAALKVVLSCNIESIRDFIGDDQAASLELLVENFERDVSEWRCLCSSDLTPLVDEELKHLITQMQKARLETQEVAEVVSLDLKSLEARKVEIGDAIDASNNALLDAEDKIEKDKEMIKRANLLLSRLNRCVSKRSLGWRSSKPRMMKSCSGRWRKGQLWQKIEARLSQMANLNEAEQDRGH